MRIICVVAAILVFGCGVSFAQVDSALAFFPLQIGNLWQYSGDIGTYTNWRLTRDSIGADSSRFLFDGIYYPGYGELPRYRIDTLMYVYDEPAFWDGGKRIYKLDADSGDTWVWWNNGYQNF